MSDQASVAASSSTSSSASRRTFLKGSAAAAAASGLTLAASAPVHAAGSDTFKVGLVGCGGRGTGAAVQALKADKGTRLVALADAFEDRLAASRKFLVNSEVADRVDVPDERCYTGFDAYQGVIADSDVVLLATPPYFRPQHLAACIEAGKHVFAEKPVAVDAPGVRSVLASTEQAKKKNLAIVSGLCWRYETGLLNTMQRLNAGAIGRPVALEAIRYSGGVWVRPRQEDMTEMEYQMRNWYYFTWLSGDFITEQFVHQLDQCAWVLGDRTPHRCYATGGRQTRTGQEYGHIYDHFFAVFDYEGGERVYAGTRHQRGCDNSTHVHVLGSDGFCALMGYEITGKKPWKWDGRRTVMHQLEHDAMYAALRKGQIINNGRYMANSTMLAIIARMSAYTGRTLTWEEAMNSQQVLGPEKLAWDADIPVPEVAMPGVTPFA